MPDHSLQSGQRKTELRGLSKIWFVQCVSLARLLSALLFASLAFQDIPVQFPALIYGFAICSDSIDGFMARRMKRASYAGKIIDLISDKSLTVVSLLYAAERDVDLPPLALIATREIVVIGLRAIIVDGSQLLPTSRLFGGVMAFVLWGNTLFFLFVPKDSGLVETVNAVYWGCALVFVVNLIVRLYVSRQRIMASLTKVE
ncbi:MAG: CDP-alcohol phosphatidyltransferase family protein [Verrucomicrobia bacterium]|nr:MAG: CDP-alcohol phosphatidyltransferase family protein [Verrucomicrobiota bacterium]